MQNHADIINWAIKHLETMGSSLNKSPEIIQETPWSNVIRLSSSTEIFYLKQPVPFLAKEAEVIRFLADRTDVAVPKLIAVNESLHCFLMKAAGLSLRKIICEENKMDLLCQGIDEFTSLQRSSEAHIKPLLKLGLPDWRLQQLRSVYDDILKDDHFLLANGLARSEIEQLKSLSPLVEEQSVALSEYDIPETVVQPDCNTNNIVFNSNTQQMTIIDLGELAISHPFFSLQNFLYTASIHHGIEKESELWYQMLDACLKNWSDCASKARLLEAFSLSRQLWPIYFVCVNYLFMHSVELSALNTWYTDKPNRLANTFRQYISENDLSLG